MTLILGPVAVAQNNCIGQNNALPWYIPEDLKRFKEITTNHTVIMGKNTYFSILKKLSRPLPNRKNVVITQSNLELEPGVLSFPSLDLAVENLRDQKLFVIGGARLFEEALPKAEYMYYTKIKKSYSGDVFFPTISWQDWVLVKQEVFPEFEFLEFKKNA